VNAARWILLTALLAGTVARAGSLPLRMEVQGSGTPAIVFEAGLGDTFQVCRRTA
jgi:hypothetical protein